MTQPPEPADAPSPGPERRVEDLPLILDRMQDQLDDLRQAIESQQRLISALTFRLAALEQTRP
jgi:hypothetical protein